MTSTDQQFREKTRTLTESVLAMLSRQWIKRCDDGASDQECQMTGTAPIVM